MLGGFHDLFFVFYTCCTAVRAMREEVQRVCVVLYCIWCVVSARWAAACAFALCVCGFSFIFLFHFFVVVALPRHPEFVCVVKYLLL